jgi:hypothetical protein
MQGFCGEAGKTADFFAAAIFLRHLATLLVNEASSSVTYNLKGRGPEAVAPFDFVWPC